MLLKIYNHSNEIRVQDILLRNGHYKRIRQHIHYKNRYVLLYVYIGKTDRLTCTS
jgi:hypothetical protein